MQPGEALTERHDLSAIGGEVAMREAGKKQTCEELASVFANPDSGCAEITLTNDLKAIGRSVGILIKNHLLYVDGMTAKISRDYDSFTQAGVTYQSKIISLHLPRRRGSEIFTGANVYMLSLQAEGITLPLTLDNCQLGVVETKDDRREFFSVHRNENYGKPVSEITPQDTEGKRALAVQSRHIDRREIIAEKLSLADEQLVIEEFKKAIGKLGQSGDN